MAGKKNTLSEAAETAETEGKAVTAETTVASPESKDNGHNTAVKEEPTYTAEEFADATEKVFGKKYNPDLVRAAFAVAGKKSATKAEALKLVKEFAERKVN